MQAPNETSAVALPLPKPVAVGPTSRRRERIPLGILYMTGATFMFALMAAIGKWQLETYPVGEVIFIRSAVSLVACGLFILPQTGLGVFRTTRLGDHVVRGASQATSQTLILIAFMLMPLAGAVAISFSAPLFATIMSAILLKEAVGPYRWAALAVGFLGVLLVTNPGADTFNLGAAFALANAVLYASVTVAVRRMTRTESAHTLTMYQMVFLTFFTAFLLPFGFVVPTPVDAALMVAAGLTSAVGQYWWTKALHFAPTSAVTPLSYLSLVWAVILGYLVWGDVPHAGLLVGSAVVVASGLFLVFGETRKPAAEA